MINYHVPPISSIGTLKISEIGMVVAFPLGKLIYLGVRQLSKPIARQLQRTAVASPFFRRYICAPPAQSKWSILNNAHPGQLHNPSLAGHTRAWRTPVYYRVALHFSSA